MLRMRRGHRFRLLFLLLLLALLSVGPAGCSLATPPGAHTSLDSTQSGHGRAEAAPGDAGGTLGRPAERPEHASAPIPVSSADPQWGDVDAPVTIVELSDFQCPFCYRVQPTLEQLKRDYGPHRLRLVFKHNPLPFHENARLTAETAAAVYMLGSAQAFFQFHDLAFKNQRALTRQNLETWASQVGVSTDALRAWLDAGKAAQKVQADIDLAKRIGAFGTPAFRINGVTLSGAQPYEKFKEVVDAQLAEARALLDSHVPPAQVYTLLTKKNFVEPAPVADSDEPPDTTVWKIPVFPDDPQRGPADALVTIVEFSDYQCPFCKRVEATLAELLAQYPNDVRLVWKDYPLPFHERARPAALLARFAYQKQGNTGFWKLHDALFANQPELEADDFKELVEHQGLVWAQAQAALEKGAAFDKSKTKLEQTQQVADDFSVRGTPNFFINGRRLSGAQPLADFKKLVDEVLVSAKALSDGGVPRAKVYAELMKQAQDPPPPETKQVALRSDAPARGNAKAPVVIQMFSDFQCPFCKRVEPTLAELEKEFKGQIRIVWRHLPLPFHQNAQPAAEAAEEVLAQKGVAAFWAYHDALFEAQAVEGGLGRDNLARLALGLGVDVRRFDAALDAGVHRAKVDADSTLANSVGINGTPAFVINDYYLSGAQPASAFRKLIKRALADQHKP